MSHPLKQLLRDQGRSVVWLAGRLSISETSLHDRLSGRRGAGGKRGPKPATIDRDKLKAAAKMLGVSSTQLEVWVSPGARAEQ